MRWIVKANYRDFAGSGWFALAKDNTVSWGFSPDTRYFDTKELAEITATVFNERAIKDGFKPNWQIMEIK
jgi:hypothetical protein